MSNPVIDLRTGSTLCCGETMRQVENHLEYACNACGRRLPFHVFRLATIEEQKAAPIPEREGS